MDAGVGSYLNSDRTDQLVLRDGGGAKTKRQVRICVDLTCLNQSVCRERHTLPAVDQTLDVNSGFWLIPLSPKSALLTTSITPDASSSSVWNFLSSGTFPAPHVRHPLWTGWCRTQKQNTTSDSYKCSIDSKRQESLSNASSLRAASPSLAISLMVVESKLIQKRWLRSGTSTPLRV